MSARSTRRLALAVTAATGLTALALTGTGATSVAAATSNARHQLPTPGLAKGGANDALTSAEQEAQARNAPGAVRPGAYGAAYAAAQQLPTAGGAWTESTKVPYDSDDLRYRDSPNNNSTAGQGLTSGRVVALADSPDHQTTYAGAANGGVFRSPDHGDTWTPISDRLPSLSTGDLATGPDGALWLATGEANTSATSYVGSGVYRLAQSGSGAARGAGQEFTPGNRVGDDLAARGGNPLAGTTINKLQFDGAGAVYAATSKGLWRTSDRGDAGWTRVFINNPAALGDPTNSEAPYANIVNDVISRPGRPGVVLAAAGWRSSTDITYYGNGFYVSDAGGAAGTFKRVTPSGLASDDIGNTTFAYSADGSTLYAVIQSLKKINTAGSPTVLGGVYVSRNGSPGGPWTQIADSPKLANTTGSALRRDLVGPGYQPGIQAWYNQFLAVDPKDPQHVYLGLEEVYETRNGGQDWKAVGPYWNFSFPCYNLDRSKNSCPLTTHSDQHDVLFSGGSVFVGNDGGVYSRPVASTAINANGNATDWHDQNAGLHSLQYYSAAAGKDAQLGGVVLSGGLQDNGGSVLRGLRPDGTSTDPGDGAFFPANAGGRGKMGSNFGGDGGDTLVDPANGCNAVGEYVYLALRKTVTPCGATDGTKPGTVNIAPLDAAPRFIAPIEADSTNPDHWFAGGNSVWFNGKGFGIASGSDWVEAANLGANNGVPNSTTQVGSAHDTAYAGFCGPCNNTGFARGLARVEPAPGGGWTTTVLAASGLPNRFVQGIWVDPSDVRHVLVASNGFSRRWTEGPDAGTGHLFESTDGGQTFKDVSGNLPDVPADDIQVVGGKVVLATDLGVFVADRKAPGTLLAWARLGGNLPAVTVTDLSVGPDGVLYAATHGRGIWGFRTGQL